MSNLHEDLIILVALEDELPRDTLSDFRIEYTGVGKVNAAFKATEIIGQHAPKLIINYGTAGSLRPGLNGVVEAARFIQRDMDASPLGFKAGETPFDEVNELSFGREGLSIGSGDNFVDYSPEMAADLVDMEAYALAKVCHLKKVDFLCFKYVSDTADEKASQQWKENVSAGKIAFKEQLPRILKSI